MGIAIFPSTPPFHFFDTSIEKATWEVTAMKHEISLLRERVKNEMMGARRKDLISQSTLHELVN